MNVVTNFWDCTYTFQNLQFMKTLTLIFIAISATTFGQFYYTNNNEFQLHRIKNKADDPFTFEKAMMDEAKIHEFKQVTKTMAYNNGKKKFTTTYLFNNNQRVSEVRYTKATLHVDYINDTLISSIVREGENARTTKFEYQGTNKVLEESFSPKKLISRKIIQYDDNNNIIFSSVSSKKTYSMHYDYEDSKLVKQRFMKDRKILKEWDYSCKPEGETIQEKNLSTVCNYVEESNDGSYVKYSRKEEKGKVMLYKSYFSKDSVCNLMEVFETEKGNNEEATNKLKSKSVYTKNTSTHTNYNKKGKIEYQYYTEFNEQKQLVYKRYSFKGKDKNQTEIRNVYNEKGLLTSETTMRKGKESSKASYEYVF